MLILKNAFKSIIRTKGRNVLVGVIIVIIALASCVSLTIKQAANDLMSDGLNNVRITATVAIDREKMMENAKSAAAESSGTNTIRTMGGLNLTEQIISADYEKLAKLDGILDAYHTEQVSLKAADETVFSPYKTTDTSTSGTSATQERGRMMVAGLQGDFAISGFSNANAMTTFIDGTQSITKGKMFSDFSNALNSDNQIDCVISNDLAKYNDYDVDAVFQAINPNNSAEVYTFHITGIYNYTSTDDTSSKQSLGSSAPALDPANAIYVNANSVQNIVNTSKIAPVAVTQSVQAWSAGPRGGGEAVTNQEATGQTSQLRDQISWTYVFNSKSDYELWKSNAENAISTASSAKIITDNYKITSADVDNFEKSLVPLQNLDNFASTLLLIILAVGALIMIVLTLFNIRERKYEVGVLTAIGIKKPKVALQFACEFLIVALISVVIGAGAGLFASTPVANAMLENQVQAAQSEASNVVQNFGGKEGAPDMPGMPNMNSSTLSRAGAQMSTNVEVNYIDQVNANVNLNILLELIGIGLLMTLIASIVGVAFVARYEPLQILADRS